MKTGIIFFLLSCMSFFFYPGTVKATDLHVSPYAIKAKELTKANLEMTISAPAVEAITSVSHAKEYKSKPAIDHLNCKACTLCKLSERLSKKNYNVFATLPKEQDLSISEQEIFISVMRTWEGYLKLVEAQLFESIDKAYKHNHNLYV